jgi:prepilin-type N-terminal cleavage/methylation domain-containing protein
MRCEQGFSLLELVIATSIMLVVMGSVFSLMNPAEGAFFAQPEVSDMQQRLRVGADTLSKDLIMAGAGAYSGTQAGSLNYWFASVLPFRRGAEGDDSPSMFVSSSDVRAPLGSSDRITLIYVPPTTAQTTLAADLTPASLTLQVASESACPVGVNLCGFTKDMSVLVYDDYGNYDMFTVTSVTNSTAQLAVKKPADASTTTYKAGAKVVEAVSHTYYLKPQTNQLMHYNGTSSADVPVVDNVVGLWFEYYGEPKPPMLIRSVTEPIGPWTTYGPRPPAIGVQATGYAAGENCTFQVDAGVQITRLASLPGDGASLVKLKEEWLKDGPFCPDATNVNRWDADLLRIRKVEVTLRVQSAAAALRGPQSALFVNGGTSRGGDRWVPDQEIRFQVSPRNLNLGR